MLDELNVDIVVERLEFLDTLLVCLVLKLLLTLFHLLDVRADTGTPLSCVLVLLPVELEELNLVGEDSLRELSLLLTLPSGLLVFDHVELKSIGETGLDPPGWTLSAKVTAVEELPFEQAVLDDVVLKERAEHSVLELEVEVTLGEKEVLHLEEGACFCRHLCLVGEERLQLGLAFLNEVVGLLGKERECLVNLLVTGPLGHAVAEECLKLVLLVDLVGVEAEGVTEDPFSLNLPLVSRELEYGAFDLLWHGDVPDEVLVSHNLCPKLHELSVINVVGVFGVR